EKEREPAEESPCGHRRDGTARDSGRRTRPSPAPVHPPAWSPSVVGPTSFQAVCHGHSFLIWSVMLSLAIASSARAMLSGPASLRRAPIDWSSSCIYRCVSVLSPAMSPSLRLPSTSGLACRETQAVLKASIIGTLGIRSWSCSAVEELPTVDAG